MHRILFIVSDPMTADILLRGQLGFLRDAGFEIAVIASPGKRLDRASKREKIDSEGIRISRRISPVADLASLVKLWRAIRRRKPHIVNASTPKAGLLGMLAARLAGVPIRVYTMRGLRLETVSGWRRRLLTAGERVAVASAHQVIAVSASLRRRMIDLRLCPAEKCKVLAPGSSAGVDTRRFHPPRKIDAPREDLRGSLGIPSSATVIGFVGRLTHDKGLSDLVEAFFGTIRHRVPEARLLVVGGEETSDPVSSEAMDKLRTAPAVTLVGFADRPEDYYRVMDVLAFPSYREGFPNAPLEAAASQIPVVGYAVTGTTDAVVDGQTGTLVSAGQVAALAEAICRYCEDPDLRRSHGEAARRRVESTFRREQVAERWAGEYRRLIEETTGRPIESRV